MMVMVVMIAMMLMILYIKAIWSKKMTISGVANDGGDRNDDGDDDINGAVKMMTIIVK